MLKVSPISVPVSKLYLYSLKSSPPQMKILLDKRSEAVYTTDGTETLRIRSKLKIEEEKSLKEKYKNLVKTTSYRLGCIIELAVHFYSLLISILDLVLNREAQIKQIKYFRVIIKLKKHI